MPTSTRYGLSICACGRAQDCVGLVSLDRRKQDLLYRALGVLACSVLRIVGYGSFSLSC